MSYTEFQILMLLWEIGRVDTFSILKICLNCGSQYMSIVGTASVGNSSDFGIKTLLEPVLGLVTSYQFVVAAATAAERRRRIATLASFLAASAASLTTDPNTNIAMGAAVGSKIGYMKAIIARGGSSQINQYVLNPSLEDFKIIAVKTPIFEVHPYRVHFTENCKICIDNMFQENIARRSFHKLKPVIPTYIAPIASTQINSAATTALFGWTFFGVGLIGLTTLSALYLFQRAEHSRWQNQNGGIIIDVPAPLSDKQ